MKKLLAILLSTIMLLSLGVTSFAAEAPTKGSITIDNATEGESYTLYKIFSASLNGNKVSYTYAGKLPANDYFKQDEAGNISALAAAKNAKGELTDGAIEFLGTIKGNAITTEEAQSSTVVFDNLPFGYYYIESTLNSAVTIDTTMPDAVVKDKNIGIVYDKKIIIGYEEDGDPILADYNTVNVGDKVEYIFTMDAPNKNGKEYVLNYFIYDQMNEALTFNDDIVVKVNGKTLTKGADKDYIVEYNQTYGTVACDFAINIPWAKISETDPIYTSIYNADPQPNKIEVTYSATVNEKVKTAGPMENDAKYSLYSLPLDDIEEGGKPKTAVDTPDPDIPWVETLSYSTTVQIKKIDAVTKEALTGAKFGIAGNAYTVSLMFNQIFEEVGKETGTHYMLKDGTFTTVDPTAIKYMRSIGTTPTVTAGYVVAEAGYAGEDAVTIEETVYRELKNTDPSGTQVFELVLPNTDLYDNLDKKYAIVEHIDKNSELEKVVSEGWVDKDGIMTFKGLGEGTYTLTELVAPNGYNLLQAPIDVTVTFDDESETFSAVVSSQGTTPIQQDENGVIYFEIANNSGTELPATGGKTTVLFIALGSVLFLAAAVLLVTKKRMYNIGK